MEEQLQQPQQIQQSTPMQAPIPPPPYMQQQQQVDSLPEGIMSLNNIIGGVPASPQPLPPPPPAPTPTILNRTTSRSARRQLIASGGDSAKQLSDSKIMSINPPRESKTRPENAAHTLAAMIVDRSGSMGSMGTEVHGGCNAYLDECRQGDVDDNTRTTVSFVRFDNTVECVHDMLDLKAIPPITAKDVAPRGSTALYDAIGCTMQKVVGTLEKLDHVPKVVIFILTDGQENASQQWNKKAITKEIKKLQAEPYNWDFYFAAANQDAMAEGHQMGLDTDACITYSSTPAGMSSAFRCQANAHHRKKRGGSKGYTMEERTSCLN